MPQEGGASPLLTIVGGGRDARRPVVYLATTVPGLGGLLVDEIQRHPRLRFVAGPYDDGRNDVVFFHVSRGANPLTDVRVAEDVFVAIGATSADADAQRLASRLISREGLERGLSVWSRLIARPEPAMTYRAIVRVLSERHFRRTSLRSVVSAAIARHRPRWRVADPSSLEIWVRELSGATFVASLRLSDAAMRQRGGRAVERHGALRPAVAAAMVALAGRPRGVLLDPFCGTGTILAEAVAAGWSAEGLDIDADAVAGARTNVPTARIAHGDARRLGRPDGSVAAVVSNLPFGRQFAPGMETLSTAVREMARVTVPGGRIVLLRPSLLPALPNGLRVHRHHAVRLLGAATTIWVVETSPDQ